MTQFSDVYVCHKAKKNQPDSGSFCGYSTLPFAMWRDPG